MASKYQIKSIILIILFIINIVNFIQTDNQQNNGGESSYYKSARLTKEFLPINISMDTSNSMDDDNNIIPNITDSNGSIMMITTTTNPILSTELNNNLNTDTVIMNSNVQSDNNVTSNQTFILPIDLSASALNNNENRLRWIDSGRHQGFPPYMPPVAGIPSGFRNPLITSSTTTTTKTMAPISSSFPAMITTTEASIEQLNYNNIPNQNFLMTSSDSSSSSSNSMTFGSIDDDFPYSTPMTSVGRLNITRVEHIVAECSDEYMKVVVRFNGTFTGLIYSSGYVHDPKCIYINGSGRSHYEFFIRLNQCGTLGRQEMYHPSMPGEARRRDHLMWNTLSIQYNSLIEEEFDEHFRLTCEYGSDFWKTVSFPFVNVEVNTGSPVVFTINPPQCQMEIRRGFGIAGTRTTGPVTVGDPLTLLIHMKSEKVGFDILVKNCIAHNGAQQRLQLIDSNGCVTNEKLISPFRGTYKADNGHQVSLFAYLKAFRFTGSLALYLECDIHMCHNRCPPQRCYWRNLSKRSAKLQSFDSVLNTTATPILSESISLVQALEVHHDQDDETISQSSKAELDKQNEELVCLRPVGIILMILFLMILLTISLGTSIRYWIRMRKLKCLQHSLQHNDYHKSTLLSTPTSSSSLDYRNHHHHHQQHNQSATNTPQTIRSMSDFSDTPSSVSVFPYRGRFCRFT